MFILYRMSKRIVVIRRQLLGDVTSVFDCFATLLSFNNIHYSQDVRLAGRGRSGSRSAASMMLDISRTMTSLGDRAFAVAGPRVWNSLPPVIRDPSLSLSVLGKLLKTYLFA